MKRMDPKKYCTNAVERKNIQHKNSKRIHCKKSQQWAMRAEVRAEASKHRGGGGEQSQQPMTTLEDKGRHTHSDDTHRGVQRVEDRK